MAHNIGVIGVYVLLLLMKATYADAPHVYNQFHDIMKEFKAQTCARARAVRFDSDCPLTAPCMAMRAGWAPPRSSSARASSSTGTARSSPDSPAAGYSIEMPAAQAPPAAARLRTLTFRAIRARSDH